VPLSPDGVVAGEPELVKDSGSVVYRAPRFSADGRFLVFSAVSANDNLQSIRIAPSTGEPVGEPVAFTRDTTLRKLSPLFSPDGAQVAYVVIQNGEDAGIAIWVADADGKNAHPLGAAATDRHLIGWLPGHSGLTFEGRQNGRKMLDAIDLGTGTTSVLRQLAESGSSFRISPDGRQVAFGQRDGGAENVWVAPTGFAQAGSGAARQLTFGKVLMSYPCWSPDGKTIAFETQNGIATVPAAGGPMTVLQAGNPQGPSLVWDWSPDGDRIAFARYLNGAINLFWISRTTRQQKQLTHYTRDNSYVRYPAWSPRGDQIVYEYSEITANIWTMRVK
jgi:Tol biopolymer transport system component